MNTSARAQATSVLVFSIALNGYQWLYRNLSATHADYAERHGYGYVQVRHPGLSTLGREVCWLKIRLALEALVSGYEWVVFLDADTRVAPHTPAVETVQRPGCHLYGARGFSGRLNSGVLILRRHPDTEHLLRSALHLATTPVDADCDVGWGENGHLIQLCRTASCVHYLDQKWNNNQRPELDDYIRHFSAGPLQHHHQANPLHSGLGRTLFHGARLLGVVRAHLPWPQAGFHQNLEQLSRRVFQHYPQFQQHSAPNLNIRAVS
ncbi:MAG: hypothetical protein VYA55_07440 [Pseudomonadota bacterium]|nr:hypothetical protein [Pseudomonadota bacterium]